MTRKVIPLYLRQSWVKQISDKILFTFDILSSTNQAQNIFRSIEKMEIETFKTHYLSQNLIMYQAILLDEIIKAIVMGKFGKEIQKMVMEKWKDELDLKTLDRRQVKSIHEQLLKLDEEQYSSEINSEFYSSPELNEFKEKEIKSNIPEDDKSMIS